MNSLYVIGGQQRSARSLIEGNGYWYEYQKGLILRVNPETGAAETCVEYVSPPEACAAEDPILFKCGTVQNTTLYVCTQTEVLIYALPHFKQIGYVSLPCFNDVHHVQPTPQGNLLVANSGLEMVLEIMPDGKVLREWNVLGEEPWGQFSKDIDYRKGINTKPHRSHPNYVFYVGEDIWTTRFHQKDAICLTKPGQQIQIGIERVHDGVFHDGLVYFTTVNGNLVIANPFSLKIEEVIDLNKMHAEDVLPGWCRGILLDEDRIWIGFSRIRPTKFRDNVSWAVRGFKRGMGTHVACYDLKKRHCIAEVSVEDHGLNAIFSIFPGAEAAII